MKRTVLALAALIILSPFAGCGSSLPAPDGSDKPSEVQEFEKKQQEAREKAANAPR